MADESIPSVQSDPTYEDVAYPQDSNSPNYTDELLNWVEHILSTNYASFVGAIEGSLSAVTQAIAQIGKNINKAVSKQVTSVTRLTNRTQAKLDKAIQQSPILQESAGTEYAKANTDFASIGGQCEIGQTRTITDANGCQQNQVCNSEGWVNQGDPYNCPTPPPPPPPLQLGCFQPPPAGVPSFFSWGNFSFEPCVVQPSPFDELNLNWVIASQVVASAIGALFKQTSYTWNTNYYAPSIHFDPDGSLTNGKLPHVMTSEIPFLDPCYGATSSEKTADYLAANRQCYPTRSPIAIIEHFPDGDAILNTTPEGANQLLSLAYTEWESLLPGEV